MKAEAAWLNAGDTVTELTGTVTECRGNVTEFLKTIWLNVRATEVKRHLTEWGALTESRRHCDQMQVTMWLNLGDWLNVEAMRLTAKVNVAESRRHGDWIFQGAVWQCRDSVTKCRRHYDNSGETVAECRGSVTECRSHCDWIQKAVTKCRGNVIECRRQWQNP